MLPTFKPCCVLGNVRLQHSDEHQTCTEAVRSHPALHRSEPLELLVVAPPDSTAGDGDDPNECSHAVRTRAAALQLRPSGAR